MMHKYSYRTEYQCKVKNNFYAEIFILDNVS